MARATKEPTPPNVEVQFLEHTIPVGATFMGLDLSLTSTGIGILTADGFISIRLQPGETLRGIPRVKWIMDQVAKLVIEHAPAAIMIEGYAMGAKTHAHSLGELGGVVKLGIGMMGIPLFVAAPGSWKKALTGNGSALKGKVILELFKRYALEISQDDQADGAALAIVCAMLAESWSALTKLQMDGLRKIEALPPLARPARMRARPDAVVPESKAA